MTETTEEFRKLAENNDILGERARRYKRNVLVICSAIILVHVSKAQTDNITIFGLEPGGIYLLWAALLTLIYFLGHYAFFTWSNYTNWKSKFDPITKGHTDILFKGKSVEDVRPSFYGIHNPAGEDDEIIGNSSLLVEDDGAFFTVREKLMVFPGGLLPNLHPRENPKEVNCFAFKISNNIRKSIIYGRRWFLFWNVLFLSLVAFSGILILAYKIFTFCPATN